MVTETMVPTREAEKVDDAIAQEISDIVEEAERGPALRPTERGTLYYRMPFAGVRYYSFKGSSDGDESR